MGDYSRCAVNTRFNTGTTVGISCSIHDEGLIPPHFASFHYGNFEAYQLGACLDHISNWKKMKGQEMTPHEKTMLTQLHQQLAPSFNL